MPVQDQSYIEQLEQAIAATVESLKSAAVSFETTTVEAEERFSSTTQQFVEQSTETVGNFVAPIAEHPWMKFAAGIPGVNFLLAAVGQVDVEKAETEVDRLRQEYPLETCEQLAHRVMVDTALKAGGIGLVTNVVPSFVLPLFAIDLAAVAKLQAEMIFRTAAIYGFSLREPARRGEVLAVFALSMGGSGALKAGLGMIEMIPAVGAVVGASSDAALLYSLGHVACQFYDTKRRIN